MTDGRRERVPASEIQASFGRHDVRGIRSHVGGAAAEASGALGARAYAVGDAVGFASAPDLHTAAHEAAHVVQQRDGVQLAGGIDEGASDPYERHADAVADAVVRGDSAEALLDTKRGNSGGQRATVQRAPAQSPAGTSEPSVTPPKSGINKQGFIDNGDGANIRTGPAEAGGQKLRDQPLPPATAVFVSGTHPDAPQWWYVKAFLDKQMVRGYVQEFRVTTDLPEPTAKLHRSCLAIQPRNSPFRSTRPRYVMATTCATTRTSCCT